MRKLYFVFPSWPLSANKKGLSSTRLEDLDSRHIVHAPNLAPNSDRPMALPVYDILQQTLFVLGSYAYAGDSNRYRCDRIYILQLCKE